MKLMAAMFLLLAMGIGGCAVTMPAQFGVNESYLTHPDSYEVLGMTEGVGTASGVLFFMPTGDAGYRAAIQQALSKAGADGLINVVADVQYNEYYFFRTWKTTVRGLAIKKK
jgi:hypothetical protein